MFVANRHIITAQAPSERNVNISLRGSLLITKSASSYRHSVPDCTSQTASEIGRAPAYNLLSLYVESDTL
jgi:hypothetical protein